MRKVYRLGEDLFIATAFVCFFIGLVGKVADIFGVVLGINYQALLTFSMMCLMFSIALSLYELTQK